jgi:uncharacterized protein YjbI with pentapeptide repeats
MEIANISRTFELQIAQDNRLHEMEIAEQSREKDRDLSSDQQLQNILVEYQLFLAKLIIDHGTNSQKKPEAKLAAHFMTLTTLNQLDTKRRSILIRSLHDANLIILKGSNDPAATSAINLQQADLRNIVFGLLPNEPDTVPKYRYIRWDHLWLPYAILTNASFRHTMLDCVTFAAATMDSVDLSFATVGNLQCSDRIHESQTNFQDASLVNASLYKVSFRFASFNGAKLTFANMYEFYCLECNFSSTQLSHADLSFSRIFHGLILHQERLNFYKAKLNHAVVRSALFRTINFDESDWSNAQAPGIGIYNCTFNNAKMDNCSFMKSYFQESVFRSASLYTIDFSNATLQNVTFINSDMRNANLSYIKCNYCDFTNVILHGGVFKNASLRYSNFLSCRVNATQLEEATDLSGSILPNGTVVKTNDYR